MSTRHIIFLVSLLAASRVTAGNENKIVMNVALEGPNQERLSALKIPVSLPGERTVEVYGPHPSWTNMTALEYDLFWPEEAPDRAQVLAIVQDWDHFAYQNLLKGHLVPGKWNHFRVDLSATARTWQPYGHHGSWHMRALMEPKKIAIRVFGKQKYKGTFTLSNVFGVPGRDTRAPFIRNVRANINKVPCFGKFELTFEIPDRYANPFDPSQVSVTADFETPDGKTIKVDGFYGRSYYREVRATGERVLPQGAPYWRVRFAPVVQGKHSYRLSMRDAYGEAQWGPADFTAIAPKRPGFVRVARADPRYFEFSDGTPFFPIGHNIRSPFDTRMDQQFPWTQRWMEGSAAYTRYFNAMSEHGENFAEIWSSAWSLGLEWSPAWRGYHGIGQFNMMNAWAMDKVLEHAEKKGIYLNLVVHNHGKFSTFSDAEWKHNPFNTQNGGYLDNPGQYFTDARALKSFRNLMRYMIARWGYSTKIFAWELWSELNLTGTNGKDYRRQEVVDWHKLMGKVVKDMDPYDHMIGTHVSGDYNCQNKNIISLPEMDFCPVDAYHGSGDPLHIVDLMRRTALFNKPFKKPVLITEFGGAWHGQGVKHLDETLHAAVWSSTCIPISATPLLWWWKLIEEEHFYPTFAAVSRFMKGEDRRDPDMTMCSATLLADDKPAVALAVQCLRNQTQALGWIYHTKKFQNIDPRGEVTVADLILQVDGMADGEFAIEFWDTLMVQPAADGLAFEQSPCLARQHQEYRLGDVLGIACVACHPPACPENHVLVAADNFGKQCLILRLKELTQQVAIISGFNVHAHVSFDCELFIIDLPQAGGSLHYLCFFPSEGRFLRSKLVR